MEDGEFDDCEMDQGVDLSFSQNDGDFHNRCAMWIDLKKRFSVGNAVRAHQLKLELAACKQNGATVIDYFGRLTTKWDELLSYKPLPKCTCSASEKIAQEYEEEKVHNFLMGLDDARFGNVRTNIIGLELLPDLNSVYQ